MGGGRGGRTLAVDRPGDDLAGMILNVPVHSESVIEMRPAHALTQWHVTVLEWIRKVNCAHLKQALLV